LGFFLRYDESDPLFVERVVPMVLLAQHYDRIPPFANGITAFSLSIVHSLTHSLSD
jgi:hypothetical protein